MYWYWKVRIYNSHGRYAFLCIKTGCHLREIDAIQEFYFEMTGFKMLLEGMSEKPFEGIDNIRAFNLIWSANT